MQKTQILIVEDEFVLYDEIAEFLNDNNYDVLGYTKSYEEAMRQITENTPDIVLLDINLIGEKDGIDIGEKLYQYKIPFIYVTDFSDAVTLKRALRTHPNIFQVKSKPLMDKKQLLIDIKTTLNNRNNKSKTQEIESPKTGIFVLKDYLSEIKNLQNSQGDFLAKELIQFNDISYISTDKYLKNSKDKEKIKVKPNYVRIETMDKYRFFYPASLSHILTKLPQKYFVRISDNTIINLALNNLDGSINGSHISVNGKSFKINNSYKKKVKKRLEDLYEM